MKTISVFTLAAVCAMDVLAAMITVDAAKPVWPDAGVRLEARHGATIEERGGTVYVQTGRCRPNTWPNVAFVYRESADLSTVRAIRATFTNCTDHVLRIALKVKGKTVQGRLPDGGCNIPAHGERMFSLPLFLERWTFDKDPHLLGLKRKPHVGDGSSYSLAKVDAIVAYIQAEDNVRFGVSNLELVTDVTAAGDSCPTAPTVLKADL